MKIKLLKALFLIVLMCKPMMASDSEEEVDVYGNHPVQTVKMVGFGEWKESLYQKNMLVKLDEFAQLYPEEYREKVYNLFNNNKLEELSALKMQYEDFVIQYKKLQKRVGGWTEKLEKARFSGAKKRNKSRKISHASTMIKESEKQLDDFYLNNLETIIVVHFNECLCVGYLRRYSIGDLGMIDLPWDSYDTMKDRVVSYVRSKYLQNPPEGLKRIRVEFEYDYDFMGNDPKIVKELNAIALREIIPSPYGDKMQNCTLHMVIKKVLVHIKEDKPFQNLPILETAVIWQNPSFVDQ